MQAEILIAVMVKGNVLESIGRSVEDFLSGPGKGAAGKSRGKAMQTTPGEVVSAEVPAKDRAISLLQRGKSTEEVASLTGLTRRQAAALKAHIKMGTYGRQKKLQAAG